MARPDFELRTRPGGCVRTNLPELSKSGFLELTIASYNKILSGFCNLEIETDGRYNHRQLPVWQGGIRG